MRLNPCAANARNSASVIMRTTSLGLLFETSSAAGERQGALSDAMRIASVIDAPSPYAGDVNGNAE